MHPAENRARLEGMTPPTSQDRELLSPAAIESEHLDDWRVLFGALHARFATGDFATGLALVQAVGAAAEAAEHHPDLTLGYPRLGVRLTSHDVGGVTRRDVTLAREISALAAAAGVLAEPAGLQELELALDTEDAAAIRPFWSALLASGAPGDRPDEITDPDGVLPAVWFQSAQVGRPVGAQRWHLDLRVPPEVLESRMAAALAAGGTLVSDAAAPAFWVLADQQGNQACLTTWQGRD